MKRVFKILIVTLVLTGLVFITGCDKKKDDGKLTIITSSFPGYDFARAITKDNKDITVKMLLKPGSEMHNYEPTPQDIKDIKNSDIFIYVGGDSDEWIDDILDNIDVKKTKVVKLMRLVDLVEEEHVEGMEAEEDVVNEEEAPEYDEHVWTSPKNAITITKKLTKIIVGLDEDNKSIYEENSSKYISELESIDNRIEEVVKNAKRKEIVFGDRFPLRYFADDYNLKYYAAFPGCSEQTEASSKTITYLINRVKKDKIPVVFHIELSNEKIAKTIAKETNAKVLEFKSAHNISQKDFDAGVTYVDIMNDNIKVLKEALN